MDEFFQNGSQETILWVDNSPLIKNQISSVFVSYNNKMDKHFEGLGSSKGCENGSNSRRNINKRMIELLEKMRRPTLETMQMKKERVHRHMISERMRREKQKQSYLALHKLLPLGTKGDKNSIIQVAAARIQELQMYKEKLMRRNNEIEMALFLAQSNDHENEELSKAKINVKVADPSCGIDSMVQVLKCLKNNGTKLTSIHSNFSPQQLSSLLEIETKIGVGEVGNAVQEV